MKVFIDAVAHFMKSKGLWVDQKMITTPAEPLENIAEELQDVADRLMELHELIPDDPRYMRAQGMTEELAELVHAMCRGDEVECLDALADLTYFVLGTAVAFDWPLQDAVAEVHQSNMSKKKSTQRLKDKGSSYLPPNLKAVLELHRARSAKKDLRNSEAILKEAGERWLKGSSDASVENVDGSSS